MGDVLELPAFQVPGAQRESVGGTAVSRLARAPNFIGHVLRVLFLEACPIGMVHSVEWSDESRHVRKGM